MFCGLLSAQFGCRRTPSQSGVLYDFAWRQTRLGDLSGALKSADAGLADFSQLDSEWHWRFLTLKAEILLRQGRYEESLALSRDDLPSKFSASDSAVWQNLTKGSAFTYLEKFPDAERALHSAQSLAASSQPQLSGEVLLRLGTLASLRWNLGTAENLYLECLRFARDHSDRFLEASALGSLGLVAARSGRYGESNDWNNKALELDRSQGLYSLVTKAEGNIGWNYYLFGDFESALAQYEQAIQDAVRASQQQDHTLWLLNSGTVFYDKGEFSSASKASLQALRLAESLNDPANTIYAKQNLALIAASTGQLDLAQQYVDESLRMEGPNPDPQRKLYTRLIDGQVTVLKKDLARAEATFSEIAKDSAATYSMQWESLAGIAQIHAKQGKTAIAEREYALSIATISKAQDAIEREDFRLSFLSSAIRFYDDYVNFLLAQNRPLDALRIADLSRAQTLEHGLSSSNGKVQKAALASAFRPQDIARLQNATLLFYWLGRQRSYLWLVSPTKVSLFPLPPGPEINSLAKSYRASFLDPRDPLETGNSDGRKLYEILIRPAEKLIAKGSRVIVLPDGKLTGLNFETLIPSDPKPHYWIDDVTLSVANSLSLLVRARREPPPKSANLLLFGDPIQPSKEFPRLADAPDEIAAVSQLFPESSRTLFLRGDAKASAYRAGNPERFSYIHFAAHGTASITRPLESALILSPEGDSFKLYARDIVQHPINAYLVSISACNGSGEREFAGEGLVGLSWGFLRAGAHHVVAGLWEVSTASTPQIMGGLYSGLKQGKDPAAALREAKLVLVHSNSPNRRPFYWAPFQLYSGS